MSEYKKCPFCGTEFETILTRPIGDDRSIQNIFPLAPPWQREQLISGVCSDECWNKSLGIEK